MSICFRFILYHLCNSFQNKTTVKLDFGSINNLFSVQFMLYLNSYFIIELLVINKITDVICHFIRYKEESRI